MIGPQPRHVKAPPNASGAKPSVPQGALTQGQFGAERPCPPKGALKYSLLRLSGDTTCPIFFAPAHPCRRLAPRQHLISKVPNGGELGLRVRCRRWSCASCSQVRKQQWVERLYLAVVDHPTARLYCCDGDVTAWARIRKAVQRAGGHFLKVALGADRQRFFLITTTAIAGAAAVDSAAVIERLAAALRSLPLTTGRPVTCSDDWLPPLDRKALWQWIAQIEASDEHLHATLEQQAAAGNLKARVLDPKTAAFWKFSASVPEEDRERIRSRLFGETLSADRVAAADAKDTGNTNRRRFV